MTRRNAIAIAALVAFSSPLANAQISAKLVMEDQRSKEHILFLRWHWSNDGHTLDAHLFLSADDILEGEKWDLAFEDEQPLTTLVKICRANKDATKEERRVQIKGREVRTLNGRAWLVESIKTL